ncbi:MAG: bacterial Ig-like domain-containing protein [Bacteroidaceae bacterium]|nr:bacterial Ig-like domain-containing protein [Bacteroidaceae bacterium]
MKQHLLKNSFLRGVMFLLLCVVGLGNTWGEEVTVTLNFSDVVGKGKSGGGAGFEYTISPINFTFSDAYGNSGHIKAYGASTITFSGATITKIVITATSNSYIGTWSDGTDKIIVSEEKATWTGSANSVTLKNTAAGQARIKTIAVTYVVDASITYSIEDRYDSGTNREYYVGDTPTADGLALIDNSGQEITEGVTWSFEPEIITSETQSVKASAEYQGVKRDEYTYNITNKGTRTLSSIEIGGTPSKTSYYIGDTPSAEGLTVKAIYSKGEPIDVTGDVTWTFNPETITEETTQVTATATYNGLTDSHTYNISAKITDYTQLENGKKYYIGATKKDIDYFFNTPYTTIENIRNNGSTDRSDATIVTAIADESSNYKWAFQFDNGNYLSLPNTDMNGYISIVSSEIYWTLSNDTKEQLIRMTTDGTHYLQINSAGYFYFGSYKSTQTNIWFLEVPTYDVEISSAGYATFCLPYDATVPSGLTAYTATDNGETVKLTAIESGKIAANEGVVLKGDEGTYTFVAAEGNVSATANNQMVGVTEDTPLTSADNAYMLTRKKDDGSIAFRLLATDYTLGANKAYLKLENNARNLISVVWDDNATGIYDLSEKEEVENGAIYNLAGQKLMRTQKGINIINGKLVIK